MIYALIVIDYNQLRNSGTPIIGVWDDHDYGIGNGDRNFIGKETFKKLYLNFIEESIESERR